MLPLVLLALSIIVPAPDAPAQQPRGPAPGSPAFRGPSPASAITKRISFAILQDYPKGESLKEVAGDFQIMKELGVTTWRGSFSWIDYEPQRGRFDYAWLHRFLDLAAKEGIMLQPYLAYTPEWAARGGGTDRVDWNDPPRHIEDWRRFVSRTVTELKPYRNIESYEVYNEENVKQWWDGTAADYNQVLRVASEVIRKAAPLKLVIMGGMVWPDVAWVRQACATYGNAARFDVIPIHAYPETWTPQSVTVENYLDQGRPGFFRREFLPVVDQACSGKPIWLNEVGYATPPGKSEPDQANWWARAFATFLADPRVEHLGIYQIRDRKPQAKVIGESENYYLGLLKADRKKKLAFHTVKRLLALLNAGSLTVADNQLAVEVTEGKKGELYQHLFVRPDGRQVLFVWDKKESPTLRIRTRPGATVTEYSLDGTPMPFTSFDGRVLSQVRLTPGMVRIFEIR
ncbi:beta-galactosidase [Geomonas sp. Red421]|uniref:Beta-galactosidase n=1 Tax=Geomonas anaerohicana TaxID=2798583 RepID=A0ABS0YK72_9BACT|nr:beta-galactosidase [Geomonas anaerohicana]